MGYLIDSYILPMQSRLLTGLIKCFTTFNMTNWSFGDNEYHCISRPLHRGTFEIAAKK